MFDNSTVAMPARFTHKQHFPDRSTTYKHDFDVDFFSFFSWNDFFSIQQCKDLDIGCRNVSINLNSNEIWTTTNVRRGRVSCRCYNYSRRSNPTLAGSPSMDQNYHCTYIVFLHGTNLSHPMAPTLELFPIHFSSVWPQRLFDSVNRRVDHHLQTQIENRKQNQRIENELFAQPREQWLIDHM